MFFKKKGRKTLKVYDPNKIYLLTTEIISNYYDGSGEGPTYTTQYFLATKEDERLLIKKLFLFYRA